MTISHYRESKQLAIISANAKAKSFSDYFHGIRVDECQTMTRGGNAISSIGIARRHWMPTVLFLRQQRKSVISSATELFLKPCYCNIENNHFTDRWINQAHLFLSFISLIHSTQKENYLSINISLFIFVHFSVNFISLSFHVNTFLYLQF